MSRAGGRCARMRYLAVIEKAGKNYSAYIPDVPGCMATGKTAVEAEKAIEEALRFHLEGMAEDGQKAPKPEAKAGYVTV